MGAVAEVATGTRTRTLTTSAVSKTGLPPVEPVGAVEMPAGGTEDRGKGAEGWVVAVNAGRNTRRR